MKTSPILRRRKGYVRAAVAERIWVSVTVLALSIGLAAGAASEDRLEKITERLSSRYNWDEFPVVAADVKIVPPKLVGRPDWDRLSATEALRYIREREANGVPTTGHWFESAELFRAAYALARRYPEGSKQRQRWLQFAIAAARRSLRQDGDNIYLAYWCILTGELGKPRRLQDALVCRELESEFTDRLRTTMFPALQLFNIYCVRKAMGDVEGARVALEDAYVLCPRDSMIAGELKSLREEMGDKAGADQIVLKLDYSKFASPQIRLLGEARKRIEIAEEAYRKGKLDEVLRNAREGWRLLQRASELLAGRPSKRVPTFGLCVNRCATLMGLCALDRGEVQVSLEWLSRSLSDDMFLPICGYDLRLVRRLVSEPPAGGACARYLNVVIKNARLALNKEEAQSLLVRLRARGRGEKTG